MPIHQITLEVLDPDQHTGEDTRPELARTLEADVGAPDEGNLFDVRLEADTRAAHLQGGSPQENEPAPYDPPPRDVP